MSNKTIEMVAVNNQPRLRNGLISLNYMSFVASS